VEIQPGVFARAQAEEGWEPDPEVGGEMRVLCETDGVHAGMSRFETDPGPISWTLPSRETIFVLEGEATIEIDGADPLTLRPGDMASLPARSRTTWHLNTPFREFWVLAG
jgi:uncharacterized cupin superfamily protein